MDTEYGFNRLNIRNPYEIPSNPEEFKKIKEEKKEKKKKEKKIKRVYFFNIEDKEIKVKAEAFVKKKRKRINYKVKKPSVTVSGVLENLGGFLELGETL